MKNVLLIGGGGREHALAWKIAQSPQLKKLYMAPGNPGMENLGECVSLDVADIDTLYGFLAAHEIELVVVGPEAPLVEGIVDKLLEMGVPAFGPKKTPAMLEGSKRFAKEMMQKFGVPTAAYREFSRPQIDEAKAYLDHVSWPLVIKADGLAAGKGVYICESKRQAVQALDELGAGRFDEAGSSFIIEEFLPGQEASVFAITDGKDYRILGWAQDHKRIGEGDNGLNTGGMGAYAPAPLVNQKVLQRVEQEIIQPIISGMAREGHPYTGILYCGLMIEGDKPSVVEFNCRFGDPECQVILPRLESDFLELILQCLDGNLSHAKLEFSKDVFCAVVAVSEGYPESYEKGKVISGLQNVNALVFHAGTRRKNQALLTNGGRVLNIVGQGVNLKEAIDCAYENMDKICFEGITFRRDIGAKGL